MSNKRNFADFYQINDKNGRCRYIDNLVQHMLLELWDKQDKVCYHDKDHKYPVLAEDAYEVIAKAFDKSVNHLREHVCMAFLDYYYRDVIDPGENRKDLEEYFGLEYPDWEDDLPKEVYIKHNHKRMTRPAFLPF
jgi:hypothetical protein